MSDRSLATNPKPKLVDFVYFNLRHLQSQLDSDIFFIVHEFAFYGQASAAHSVNSRLLAIGQMARGRWWRVNNDSTKSWIIQNLFSIFLRIIWILFLARQTAVLSHSRAYILNIIVNEPFAI